MPLLTESWLRDGMWLKTELAGQYKGKVAIGELESLCQLLVTADVIRFELELLERITNEDADRFDDKVFMLAQIAYDVADGATEDASSASRVNPTAIRRAIPK